MYPWSHNDEIDINAFYNCSKTCDFLTYIGRDGVSNTTVFVAVILLPSGIVT